MSSLRTILVLVCALAGCGDQRVYLWLEGDAGKPNHEDAAGEDAMGGDGPIAGCTRSAPIMVGHVVNARDLGGIPVAPAGSVACGAIYRGPPLANLTAQGCDEFAQLGIRTVVDLRIASERALNPEAPCVDANMVLAPLPIPFGLGPADYLNDLYTIDSIGAAFRAFGDGAAYPVYFHCTWGRDRTGVVGAVLLLALGVKREDILLEYSLSKATVGAYPASLTAVLDEIEQSGGIDAYLALVGVTESEIAVLRDRAMAK
jgi:protein-tyrosine phosphatase